MTECEQTPITDLYDTIYFDQVIKVYHTTNREAARLIESTERFEPSHNSFEWLGWGVYFFIEHHRAESWAKNIRKRYGRAAIITVNLQLGRCVYLSDPNFQCVFLQSKEEIKSCYSKYNAPLPEDRCSGRHDFTCMHVNFTIAKYFPDAQTIMAHFEEGVEVIARSYSQSHTQISVIDHTMIHWPIDNIEWI